MKKYRNNIYISLFLLTGLAAIFLSAIQYEKFEDKKISANLERIYNAAITLERTNVNLHEDSDGFGKYKILSDSVGVNVYNKRKKNSYSLIKDYHNLEDIKVYYGLDGYSFPNKELKVESEDYGDELFSYVEIEPFVIITGFSNKGREQFSSESKIEIPSEINGYSVSEIADGAFKNMNITGEVFVPETVKKIGVDAFSGNGEKRLTDNIKGPGLWIPKERKWIKLSVEIE